MKKFRVSPASVILLTLGVLSIIFNIVNAIILPEKIQTQFNFGDIAAEPMNKYLYLAFSSFIIAISSGMGLYFKDKRLRYTFVTVILTVANAAILVMNLIKM